MKHGLLALWCLLLWTGWERAEAEELPKAKPQAMLTMLRPPSANEIKKHYTRAKYEPAIGCYIGAFVDFDSTLNAVIRDEDNRKHQDPSGFEAQVGKPHAMYFFYMGYGKRLPMSWIRWLATHNKFVHIALQPDNGLDKVKDDAYLRKFADDCRLSGAKIFLRFASEMNGDWVNYHKNPAQFRAKFRLVHKVMHQRAPNVATVWCPYTFPRSGTSQYYPGDDGCDWIGCNLYNVTYHNNNLNSPGEWEHPADLVSFIYDKYATRKPMMICEYAASHYAECEGRERPSWAANKILMLYTALPRLFPRVKAVCYFDGNNRQFVPDRPWNDYSVTTDPLVRAAYAYGIKSNYYLAGPLPDPPNQPIPAPIALPVRKGELLQGRVTLSCWARSPSDAVMVRFRVDGREIYKASRPDLWECIWDAGSVRPGRHTLTLEVLKPGVNRVVARQSLSIVTRL